MGSLGTDQDRPMSPTRAAVRVQAAYRAYQQRKEFRRQQKAVQTIQRMARAWLQRRRACAMLQREASEARFKSVMNRHMQRIQQLEAEKQQLQQLPLHQLDMWQQKRHQAAARIQAVWRGRQHRRTLHQKHPALAYALMRCDSPDLPADTAADQDEERQQQQGTGGMHASVTALPPSAGSMVCVGSSSLTASDAQWQLGLAAGGGVGSKRVISEARRAQLLQQVSHRIEAKKAAASVSSVRSSAAAAAAAAATAPEVARQLQQLLVQKTATEEQRMVATAQRQQLLQRTELLCTQLQQLPTLASMPPSAQPTNFPLPPREGGRLAAARQGHALALAEAKVSSRWWLPLKQLCEADMQLALQGKGGAWAEHWAGQEAAWQQSWQQLRKEQQLVEEVLPLS